MLTNFGANVILLTLPINLYCTHFFRFYECWKESELSHAHAQQFNIEEEQLKSDWSVILSSADRQGKPLEQIHIFVLSHILRRPVIVYGVKMVKNYKGEQLGLANFEGKFSEFYYYK